MAIIHFMVVTVYKPVQFHLLFPVLTSTKESVGESLWRAEHEG